jgi:RND family efflux transporter MFP subunit
MPQPSPLAALKTFARTRAGLPVLIAGCAVAIVVVLTLTRPRLQPVPGTERVWTVHAIEVRHETLQPELDLFGEVIAGRRSELRSLVAGPIARVGANFRAGGIVRQGELLVQVDPFDYETALAEARSRLKEAEVRLTVVNRDLRRARDLFAQKLVAPQFLDNAELAVEQQEAIVEQQRIAVRRAERDLRDTRLLAPYDGVVGNVSADLGKQLSLNDKVADVTDMGRLEVRFSLSNAEYGRLLESGESVVGRPVRVIWEVGTEKLDYTGSIARVGAEITATTGGVDAYAVIAADAARTPLRPGAFVRVRVADRRYEGVVQAPESALYGEETVYVVNAEQRLEARRVRVVGYAGSNMIIRSAGEPPVRDGDRLLTTQLREIGAGVKVALR